MQSMIDAAVQMGFSVAEAETLVEQTFMGAIHLLNNNNFSCKEWIDRVASRGGTTEAALRNFKDNTLNVLIGNGLHHALDRSRELGG